MKNQKIFNISLSAESGQVFRNKFDVNLIKKKLFEKHFEKSQSSVVRKLSLSEILTNGEVKLNLVKRKFNVLKERMEDNNFITLRKKSVLECGPLFFSIQYLLHNSCGNWNNESESALSLLKTYATDVGYGKPGTSRIDKFIELARECSVDNIFTEFSRSNQNCKITNYSFELPSQLMMISHFPNTFMAEILGINLFYRSYGVLPIFLILFKNDDTYNSLFNLDSNHTSRNKFETLKQLALSSTTSYLDKQDNSENALAKVMSGFNWALESTVQLSNHVHQTLVNCLDPRHNMVQLIDQRRLDAALYHKNIFLGRDSLSDLFKSSNTLDFLDLLAESPYIKKGDPDNSPFLNGLLSPNSKMFRIFTQNEIEMIRNWIKELPYENLSNEFSETSVEAPEHFFENCVLSAPAHNQNLSGKARDFYSRLLQTEISNAENHYAKSYVDNWLRSASALNDCPLPQIWEPMKLDNWLQTQHLLSMKNFDLDVFVPLKKELVVKDLCSLAPLTMIDGAWLIGFSHPMLVSSPENYSLFETYYDELGNGELSLNHPTIYRELLETACGEIPEIDSSEFSHSILFDDKNFELPVFWLSIGKFPKTYFPEIIGLNLAMELSGVGGGYNRVSKSLRAHNLPCKFSDMHNSIDNVATGHSAWAAASIDYYMAGLVEDERKVNWERVKIGFMSLKVHPKQSFMKNIINFIRMKI